ncbi:MAG: methyltransferase domain-containing protein [Legionellales bacterium]|nr:methyltransferase domain-containing protein [Legionellales bacterium]
MQHSYAIELSRWYQSPLGQMVVQSIARKLQLYLPNYLGNYLLQMGVPTQTQWLLSSPICNRLLLSELWQPTSMAQVVVRDRLPVLPGSIDVALVMHSLESTDNPHNLLAEMYQALHGEGYLLIIGFNPWSAFGLRRWLGSANLAPWNRHWRRAGQIKRWLTQAQFTVHRLEYLCYYPPINLQQVLKRLFFLETLGEIALPYPGGLYLLIAQKITAAPTLIRPYWQIKPTSLWQRLRQPSANRTLS